MEKKSPQTAVNVHTQTAGAAKNQPSFAETHSGSSENNGPRPPQGPAKGGGGKRLRNALVIGAALVLAAVVVFTFGGKKDDVDAQTKKQWEMSFIAAQPLGVKLVKPAETPTAIANMPIPEAEKQQLQKEVDTGRARLVWVWLRDNCAEDGDTVRIDSGRFSQTVKLKNAGERIAVPEPPSGVLNVVGIYDGGGGITVEMKSGESPVNLPVMTPGQTLGVPVTPLP